MSSGVSRLNDKQSLIWYASYGSNMSMERFTCYIKGGTPAGGLRSYIGCDDQSLPLSNTKIELPYQLYFVGESPVWSGGIAVIGHERGIGATKGRAYLITTSQFEQIVMQESRRVEVLPIDMNLVRAMGRQTLGDGSGHYDELIYCGEYEDYPVVSFTSPVQTNQYAKPSSTYLKMITKGLIDSHDLNFETIADYLLSKPGVSGNYSRDDLLITVS